MPSASSITLADGQATPVNHTFDPLSVTPSQSLLVDKSSVTSGGMNQLIVGLDPSKSSRRTNRVSIRFNMPIEQTVSGVTEVAYTARFSADVILPDQMTQAERDDMGAFIKNALSDSVVNAIITDLDPLY
jgi:hypothetical protein